MPDNTVRGTRTLTNANSMVNAIEFLVEALIHDNVNTAELVTIGVADQTGTSGGAPRSSATPLVCQLDGYNNTIRPATISNLPVYRPQAGKAAIIMDPQPGDKALAVFANRDTSNVGTATSEPVRPGSFRTYDQSDGFLLNGFMGDTPEIWLKLDPATGEISLSTKSASIDISVREAGDIDISTASGNVSVTSGSGNVTVQAGAGGSGTITLDGSVIVTRTLAIQNKNGEGGSTMQGGFTNTGGKIVSNGITLETHPHGGVQTGGGNTTGPIGG